MNLYTKLFFSLLLQIACSYAKAQTMTEIQSVQRSLVAKMTGQSVPENSRILTDRSRFIHRRASVGLLTEALREIALKPEHHKYAYPNNNFFIDLLFDPYRGTNVYTIIPSTVPSDEYVILGAHYDSEPGSPGADDNASGVALVYMIGKMLSELEHRDINFMLVFFDQEENDEIGSKAFARKVRKEKLNIHSVHVADMVGWDSDGDRAVELSPTRSTLVDLYREAGLVLGIPIYTSNAMSSDHKSFHDAGYEAVLLSEEYKGGDFNPHYHSPEDVYEIVDFDYLESCTRLTFEVMKNIISNNQLTDL